MIRFEIDPNLSADAIREGRKIVVTLTPHPRAPDGFYKKVTLGDPSPYRRAPFLAKQAA